MQMVISRDIRDYCERVMPSLLLSEVQNNLPVGILQRGLRAEEENDWLMARLEDEAGQDVLIALMTPPHNLILVCPGGGAPQAAVRVLAEKLRERAVDVPGVFAEKALSHAFAQAYCAAAGLRYEVQMNERVYRLDAVADIPHVGALRPAEERDMHFLPYWLKAFEDECLGAQGPLDAQGARAGIERGELFLLEADGRPVSLVGSTRQMPGGRSVGPVYTPPYLRGNGFASCAVAQISRLILARGNAYCALFTDLSNPISNSIYQKVGYRPICDYMQARFDPAAERP